MKRKERGVTLIALVVTIVVLLILASIGIGAITSDNGVIKQSNETKQSAERESIIEKIEADLYTKKTKTGKTPSKNDLKELIKEKDFGTVNEDDSFTSKIGNYKIEFEEIQGWEKQYKEVAYLESTGTQYINTEIIPDNDTGIKMRFSQNKIDANYVSGCVTDKWNNRFYPWYFYSKQKIAYGYGYYYSYEKADLELNKEYLGTLNYKNDKKAIFDGYIYKDNIGSYSSSNVAIYLFATKTETKVIQNHLDLSIYEVEVTQKDSIIRDFIPVLDEDNKPCLYDKVEKKYYYNQGTGEFLYGE